MSGNPALARLLPSWPAGPGRLRFGVGAAAASYALVTAAMAWPLLRSLAVTLPGDRGDPVLNAWILWWSTEAAPLTGRWWDPPVFHPYPDTLAYSEHLLGLLPLSAPVQWLTGSPVVTYNVTFLATFVLSGVAAYVLGRELTGRRDAAWLAGLVFAFAPYRLSQIAHVQVLASFWMPLALAALHRYARDRRPRWLVAFAAATLMQGLSSGYYLAYFPVLAGLWALWFSRRPGWLRQVFCVGGAGLAALLPLWPVLAAYRRTHDEQGLTRLMAEVTTYSADLTALVSGSADLAVWGWLDRFGEPEQQLFPGATVVILIGVVLWSGRGWRSDAEEPQLLRSARRGATVLAILAAGALAARLVAGPSSIDLLGLRISITRVDNVAAQAALAGALAALLSPTCVGAWRRRSPAAFYLIAAAVLGLCAMGPYPAVAGTPVLAYSPYLALMQLPGFDALRVPARFWMLALVCLSAVAALAYARLAPSGGGRRALLLAAAAAGVLLDGWARFPIVPAPSASPLLEARARGPVAELPLGWRDDDAAAMLRGAGHGQPVVNGYSGYAPPYYGALGHGLRARDGEVLAWLAEAGVRHVRLDRTRPAARRLEAALAAAPGLRLDAHTAAEALYTFAGPRAAPPPPRLGRRLRVVAAAASENEALVAYAIDGAHGPRWTTGPQEPGQWLRLDLGAVRPVGGVVLWGSLGMDYPRRLLVETSHDGVSRQVVWEGPTETAVLRGALRDPRAPLAVTFPSAPARFVRLRQTGADPVFAWSVTEVDVHAPAR